MILNRKPPIHHQQWKLCQDASARVRNSLTLKLSIEVNPTKLMTSPTITGLLPSKTTRVASSPWTFTETTVLTSTGSRSVLRTR